jgi:hypothetical protein
MVISDKQHQANRENAQHSTGPTTPEGKAAVRLNALKYGLRAQDMLLPGEDPTGYMRLWDELVDDWQPENRTERLHLEQMCITQWLLSRVACAEHHAYAKPLSMQEHFVRLILIAKYKTTLERSFDKALISLRQSKKDRRAQPVQPAPAAKPAPAPEAPPTPAYVMSEGAEIHEVYCAPATTDTR